MAASEAVYREHAVESFEFNAIDYLLKPFSLARLVKACNKAQEQLELRKRPAAAETALPAFFIKSGCEQIRINAAEILYVESLGNYVQFVLATGSIVSRMTMNEVVGLLPALALSVYTVLASLPNNS